MKGISKICKMINPFKRKVTIDYIEVFTGYVRFIDGRATKVGKIFGKPFRKNVFDQLYYHIESGGKVYEIPEHAIEKIGWQHNVNKKCLYP